MEALEEHVLRLVETAHVLYPRRLISPGVDGRGVDDGGSLGRHADVLTEHAEQARAIPKNLRSLYQLLSRTTLNDETVRVATIFEQAFIAEEVVESRIKTGRDVPEVGPEVATALGLIFGELASNHRVHGKRDGDVVLRSINARSLEVELPIRQGTREEYARLVHVALTRMQSFLAPAEGVEESSGVGLYLANLAASTVGWKIEIGGGEDVCEQFGGVSDLTEDQYEQAAACLVNNSVIVFRISEVSP